MNFSEQKDYLNSIEGKVFTSFEKDFLTDPFIQNEDEIIEFARTRIAGYKCPKSIDFIEELPRNPGGKILRRELRVPYWKGKDRNVS